MLDPTKLGADIRAHLEAENAYTEAMMADTAELQTTLVAEMRARMAEADASVPTADGDWVYYVRFREGGQHPIFCRAPRAADGRAAASEAQHAFARPIKPLSLPSGMDGRSPSRTTRIASATPARSGASS